jgi:hypothetical protein
MLPEMLKKLCSIVNQVDCTPMCGALQPIPRAVANKAAQIVIVLEGHKRPDSLTP